MHAEPRSPPFLGLPREILHGIIVECDPVDLAALGTSCAQLRDYIRGNKLLHRDTYLRHFDTPPAAFRDASPDWPRHLHDLVRLQKIFDSRSTQTKQSHLADVVPAVRHLLATAPAPSAAERHPYSRNIALLTTAFRARANVNALLAGSTLFARAGSSDQVPAPTGEQRQLAAQLHVLYGVPINSASFPTHHNARSKVYDLRNYTADTFWGPFANDGSAAVDWEKLEAVMVVLCFNLRQFSARTHGRFPQLWRTPFLGAQPGSYVSGEFKRPAAGGAGEDAEGGGGGDGQDDDGGGLEARDPYGITGTWMRVVCFLDYSDLYTYNFSRMPPAHEPREPLNTEEAIRLITLKLQVTKIEPPSEGMGQELPCVYFDGSSRSMHAGWDPNANSRIRGRVHLTSAGEVRWTTFSVFHGEERWRSEGIQVGGRRSARGVWGHWFDKDFDEDGPAGPTAFWKLTDELPTSAPPSGPDFAAQQQHHALQNMLALQHIQLLQRASASNGALHGHWIAVSNIPIAGAGAGVPDGVDGTHPYNQIIDSDEDGDAANGVAPQVGAAGLLPSGDSREVDLDADDDEEEDNDYVPPPDDGDGNDDEDDDIDIEGDDDDVIVEEAYVEEEIVPLGEEDAVPDGEEIIIIGEGGGSPGIDIVTRQA